MDHSSAPWTKAQARAVAACNVGAALVILFSATSADGRGSLSDQVVWLNLGVLALLLAAVANGSLFMLARRAVGHRRLELLPNVIARVPATASPVVGGRLLWLPRTSRAHVEGCPMIDGKPAKELSAKQVQAKSLERCEICG